MSCFLLWSLSQQAALSNESSRFVEVLLFAPFQRHMLLHLVLDLGVSTTSKDKVNRFWELTESLDACQLPLPQLEEGLCQPRLPHLKEVPSLPARTECVTAQCEEGP